MANEITKITDQKTGVDHPLRDAAAQTALTGILNGQSIDSFGDVESALETSETTITTPSDATVSSNYIYKFGKVVTAYLYATNITAERYAGFATIPEGYRPKAEFFSAAQGGTDSIYGVRTNGQIYNNKQALASSDTVVFYATWITN